MTRLFAIWLTVTAVSLGAVALQADESDDQVIASFDRELNREPTPRKEVTRDAIDEDALYVLVNEPLQTKDDSQQTDHLVAEAEK